MLSSMPLEQLSCDLLQDKVTIYSQASKRITKRNSYTVTFVNAAIIQELKVHRCMELQALDFPSDIQCLSDIHCSDFVSVLCELPKLAVPVEHILAKCFDISSVGVCVMCVSSPQWSVIQKF